jgi:hypothetical protein
MPQTTFNGLVRFAAIMQLRRRSAAECEPSVPDWNACVLLKLMSNFRRMLDLRPAADCAAIQGRNNLPLEYIVRVQCCTVASAGNGTGLRIPVPLTMFIQ